MIRETGYREGLVTSWTLQTSTWDNIVSPGAFEETTLLRMRSILGALTAGSCTLTLKEEDHSRIFFQHIIQGGFPGHWK